MDDLKNNERPSMNMVSVSSNEEQIVKLVEVISTGMELYEYQIRTLKQIIEYHVQKIQSRVSMDEILDEYIDTNELSIKDIKRKIKYSKNPLEVLQLQRRLNSLYKKKYR